MINLIGILLIGFIVWWFWLYRPKLTTKVADALEIIVKDGIYQPAYIEAKINKPITLKFIRYDASPCAEVVNFNSLNVNKQLPLQKPVEITLTLKEAGEYEFTCQMGMYRGKIMAS